jgi:hypothetical protein
MPGLGLLPTDPAQRFIRAPAADHHVVRSMRAALPTSADLSAMAPRVLDQKQTSTCWAHSAATLLYTRRHIQLGGVPPLMSPLFFAQIVYGTMRAAATKPGDTLPALQDTGAELDTADACFGKWGCSPFLGDGLTDLPTVDADGFGIPELAVTTVEAASARLFSGPYDIAPDSAAPETVAACIAAGIPVWLGGLVGPSLDSYRTGTIEQPWTSPQSGPGIGGHARAILGFRSVPGGLELLIRNSWGPTWGDGGSSWASAEVITSAWSLLPFQVSP